MADLAERIAPVRDTGTVKAAFCFILTGVALKLALFPMHAWLPNAYAYAPSVVTAFLAGSATKVAVYVMLRFMFTIFGAHFSLEVMQLSTLLLPLALAGIVICSAVATLEHDVKRLLAYSQRCASWLYGFRRELCLGQRVDGRNHSLVQPRVDQKRFVSGCCLCGLPGRFGQC